jgi:hypothetical protein
MFRSKFDQCLRAIKAYFALAWNASFGADFRVGLLTSATREKAVLG